METKTPLFRIFTDYEGKTPFSGNANFAKGKKECPNCKGNMIRKPLKQPYVNAGNDYLLVDPVMSSGILKVVNTEPDYAWFCNNCSLAMSCVKQQPIIFEEEE